MALGIKVLGGLAFVLDSPGPTARIVNVGDSNIVIQFFGWIDQREAAWFKSRSLAIANVKDALEAASPCRSRSTACVSTVGPIRFRSVAPQVGAGRRPGRARTAPPGTG